MTADDGLRQRPEDQPLPVANDRPGAHDQLIAQLLARRELGLRRYGALLQPHNGRDTGRDLVEELLDGAVYAQTLATELADLRALEQRARGLVTFWRSTSSSSAHQAAADLEAALADGLEVDDELDEIRAALARVVEQVDALEASGRTTVTINSVRAALGRFGGGR